MLDYYINLFTETAKKMGRNYVGNTAIDCTKNVMDTESYSMDEKLTFINRIHKAYSQVFVDDSLPWSTAEIYKPEPVEDVATPFDIENDPF